MKDKMMIKFALLFLLFANFSYAQELSFQGTEEGEQIDLAPKYTESIIYIFYNGESCYECDKAISEIRQVYEEDYKDKYEFYVVDYQSDLQYNYIGVYNLSQPLEVVMARVVDGIADGFEKIEGLEYEASDPVSLGDDFRYRINSFLGQ